MKTVTFNKKKFLFYAQEGIVAGPPRRWTDTEWGSTSIGTKYTYLVIYDEFFLKTSHGEQKAFQLKGFNLACMEGHKLKVISGGKALSYVAVHNESTGATYFSEHALEKMFRGKPWPYLLRGFLIGAACGVVGIVIMPALAILGIGIGAKVWEKSGRKAAKSFMEGFKSWDYAVE